MVLQDDVPALEILSKDGVWIAAEPKPNTFVCNVGRFLERMTNNKFVATVHRVRNVTGQRRYSIPFFLTPDPDAVLKVLDCCLEPGEELRQDECTVGELYVRRVLPARPKHPKSSKYKNVPIEELKYDLFYTDI
jgi:isopenicillin N synthase-like dioxygenase